MMRLLMSALLLLTIWGVKSQGFNGNNIGRSIKNVSLDTLLIRQPYLQKSSENSMTVLWKTNVAVTSQVRYGTDINNLNFTTRDLGNQTFHNLTLSNLSANTKYFYVVGDTTRDYSGESDQQYFVTHPLSDSQHPIKVWVLGDSGSGTQEQKNVRDAYLNRVDTTEKADIILMLGDNAYETGTASEYQTNLFDIYDSILMNTVLFPTSGNHDFYSTGDPVTQTGPYFDVFDLPVNGECGGIPSGTEAYYSFDYGNVHFVNLETYVLDRSIDGEMAKWLIEDLAGTSEKWIIAYWHYAPYSKVGHDSDDPDDHYGKAIEMREVFNPIIESFGVDLVLCGHSHNYARSYFLDGHYGFSNSLTSDMILNPGSGNAFGDGAYEKLDGSKNSGTVYMICGNSGRLDEYDGSGFHPAMYRTIVDTMGSVILDISNDTLSSRFISDEGLVQDQFHIVKSSFYTEISSTERNGEIKLFPNPVFNSSLLYVSATPEVLSEVTVVRILDIASRESLMVKLNPLMSGNNIYSIDISNLPQGIYSVFFGEGNTKAKRFVVL